VDAPLASPVSARAVGPARCATVAWRSGGACRVTVVVKATFAVEHGLAARLVDPDEVVRSDRRSSSIGPSGLEAASELAPLLPGARVLLTGHACAPVSGPVGALRVRLAVWGERALVDKTLHVLGDREADGAPPRPFDRAPLVYELAYGGLEHDENPVGTGAGPSAPRPPRVLDPAAPRETAGFGPRPVARPRLCAREGSPVLELPDGFDPLALCPAPPDQRTPELRGDEWIVLEGLSPVHALLSTRLPSARAIARWHKDSVVNPSAPERLELALDTVSIDADRRVLSLVFRGSFALADERDLPLFRVVAGVDLPEHPLELPPIADEEPPEEGWFDPTTEGLPDRSPTEPPPPDETPESLALRPLAPFPVAPPSHRVPQGAPIPGAPWGPPLRGASPEIADEGTSYSDRTDEDLPSPRPISQPPSARVPEPDDEPPPAPAPVPKPPRLGAALDEAPEAPRRPVDELRAIVEAGGSLEGRDLGAIDLAGADLRGLSLARCLLRGARLSGADLTGARLAGAQLAGADLTGAILVEADLSRADLKRATLAGATLDRAELGEVNLSSAEGPEASFEGARGKRPIFARGTWDRANFRGADLAQADFTGASIEEASFVRAGLAEARLGEAKGRAADLTEARLPRARAEGAVLPGASLVKADAPGSIWDGAELRGVAATKAGLRGASFVRAALAGADLGGADLAEARLRQADLARADLTGASLRSAKMQRVTGEGARFVRADLDAADLRHATLPGAELEGVTMHRAWADQADLARASFDLADLRRASFRGARLAGATFVKADLDGADLREADLEGANMHGAKRQSAKLAGAKTDGMTDAEPTKPRG
jgi:uncharacterized protein YjbI with pentapeptide repeats